MKKSWRENKFNLVQRVNHNDVFDIFFCVSKNSTIALQHQQQSLIYISSKIWKIPWATKSKSFVYIRDKFIFFSFCYQRRSVMMSRESYFPLRFCMSLSTLQKTKFQLIFNSIQFKFKAFRLTYGQWYEKKRTPLNKYYETGCETQLNIYFWF